MRTAIERPVAGARLRRPGEKARAKATTESIFFASRKCQTFATDSTRSRSRWIQLVAQDGPGSVVLMRALRRLSTCGFLSAFTKPNEGYGTGYMAHIGPKPPPPPPPLLKAKQAAEAHLRSAALNGNLKGVLAYMAAGVDVDARDVSGLTALHGAGTYQSFLLSGPAVPTPPPPRTRALALSPRALSLSVWSLSSPSRSFVSLSPYALSTAAKALLLRLIRHYRLRRDERAAPLGAGCCCLRPAASTHS